MEDIELLANLAEIFGGIAVVVGIAFGFLELVPAHVRAQEPAR